MKKNVLKTILAIPKIIAVLLALALNFAFLVPIFTATGNFSVAAQEIEDKKLNQYERDAALALLSGQSLVRFDQMNERLVQQMVIENMGEPLNTVAIGSSRILQLSAETVGTDSFYNLGMSGADYRDIMNSVYLLDKSGVLPENLIIGLDPWIFNPEALHSLASGELFAEFLQLRLGYESDQEPPILEDTLTTSEGMMPDMFWGQFNRWVHDEWEGTPPPIIEEDIYDSSFMVKLPDGSALYPPHFRNDSQSNINDRAFLESATFLHMDGYVEPDADLIEVFERFISYLKDNNVNVIIVLSPYHPYMYQHAFENAEQYPGFFLTEPWITDFALQNNIPLYGSYNPAVAGTVYSDFYDGLHVKRESISTFFPGVEAALQDAQNAVPGSPWLSGATRVSYETAISLLSSRYGIEEPEIIQRDEDTHLNGDDCYVVHRIDTSQNDLLLATYAISMENGIIYRIDTNINAWVMDLIFSSDSPRIIS